MAVGISIEMSIKPINPFEMSEQSLLILIFMDSLNHINWPQVENPCSSLKCWLIWQLAIQIQG